MAERNGKHVDQSMSTAGRISNYTRRLRDDRMETKVARMVYEAMMIHLAKMIV